VLPANAFFHRTEIILRLHVGMAAMLIILLHNSVML
jgi:hypothetical protein